MNEFSKLNRNEMRKITGGVAQPPGVCDVNRACLMGFEDPQNHPHTSRALFGICTDRSTYGNVGCICEGENGSYAYSDCLMAS